MGLLLLPIKVGLPTLLVVDPRRSLAGVVGGLDTAIALGGNYWKGQGEPAKSLFKPCGSVFSS